MERTFFRIAQYLFLGGFSTPAVRFLVTIKNRQLPRLNYNPRIILYIQALYVIHVQVEAFLAKPHAFLTGTLGRLLVVEPKRLL